MSLSGNSASQVPTSMLRHQKLSSLVPCACLLFDMADVRIDKAGKFALMKRWSLVCQDGMTWLVLVF